MSKSLWNIDSINSKTTKTDNVVSLIREQAALLKTETNNQVFAKFGVIATVGFATALKAIGSVASEKEVVSGENTDDLADANALYKPKAPRPYFL